MLRCFYTKNLLNFTLFSLKEMQILKISIHEKNYRNCACRRNFARLVTLEPRTPFPNRLASPYLHYLLWWLNGHCLWVTSVPQMKSTNGQQALKGWHQHLLMDKQILTLLGQQGSSITLHSNLWDTGVPQTVAWQLPIVCFLYTFYRVLHGNFISKHIQNGFVWKNALSKKFLRHFVRIT